MTHDTPNVRRELPWDPIWQYVLGEGDESMLSGSYSFEASTIESADEDYGSIDDEGETLAEDYDSTRKYVSRAKYDEAIESLALIQQLAEERRLRNEALAATLQARRFKQFKPTPPVLPIHHPIPMVRSSHKRAYSLEKISSSISTASNKSRGPVKYWPHFRPPSQLTNKKKPTSNESMRRESRDSTSWEWELDPDIFPAVALPSSSGNNKRDADGTSCSSNGTRLSKVQKAKGLVKQLWCRSVARDLEQEQMGKRLVRSKTGTTSSTAGSSKK